MTPKGDTHEHENVFSYQNNDFIILKDNKELVRGEIEPVLAHCPEQAYITLSEHCIYDCKFCSVPELQSRRFLFLYEKKLLKVR